MTVFQFFHRTGFEPKDDDLDRVNCPLATCDVIGHQYCGVCEHGTPKFLCAQCAAPFAPWHGSPWHKTSYGVAR